MDEFQIQSYKQVLIWIELERGRERTPEWGHPQTCEVYVVSEGDIHFPFWLSDWWVTHSALQILSGDLAILKFCYVVHALH